MGAKRKYDYDNCVGKKYNDFIILSLIEGKPLKVEVECFCGCIKQIMAIDVLRGHTKNCGCRRLEKIVERNKTIKRESLTQYKKMPEYAVWASMKYRCNNPSNEAYKNYGGRGIKVCPEWNKSFADFIADMGSRPSDKHTLDRVNNDDGYNPDNCRWTDRTTQARNQRVRKDNKLGVRGVNEAKEGVFTTYITINKKRKHLGQFSSVNEAKKARKQAELTYW